jgi:uroporphyrin-3 C-methyltransferase
MITWLVTRPAPQAAEWVERLAAHGVAAQALPLIAIAAPHDPAAVEAAWQTLAQHRLVVFVSPNAAERFFALRPGSLAWPDAVQAAAPGPGTSETLRTLGVPAAAIVEPAADAAQFDAEALWQRLAAERWAHASVLIVRGDGGREWLADTLKAHGAAVSYVSAYRRVAPVLDVAQQRLLADAIAQPQAYGWLFSSSEAIEHLQALAPQARFDGATAIATHPRIAERARAAGFVKVQPSRPALAAVVACIQSIEPGSPPSLSAVNDVAPASAPRTAAPPPSHGARWAAAIAAVLGVIAVVALMVAWKTDQRVAGIEQELVRRQQDSQNLATEARMLAKQAHEGMSDAAAKVALLEARVAEVAIQRTQLEDLIQSLSRSRDENLLVDIEAAIRMALQQGAITGSAEPLVLVLRQSDERLARYSQPRLEGVRRAIARDLDRVKTGGAGDIATLTIKLDEVMRVVDELPLLSTAEPRKEVVRAATAAAAASRAARPASAASSAGDAAVAWLGLGDWQMAWRNGYERVWAEVRSLVRVTRIDHPDAVLLAPEQSFFVRENLKLRLLNARLALLSRQFPTAQADLQVAQSTLERYFDRSSRRTLAATELLKQVNAQARQITLPRPDDTLAALTTAAAGR